MAIKSIKAGHGLSGSSLGHPENMGVVGPTCNFSGRKMPQDVDRKVSVKSGEGSGMAVPKSVGIKKLKTGGMSRKNDGVVGPGKYMGTK